ncbi:hypothetical protein ABE26_09770 [Cytobacillus firmus]|nr:hypothetical protein [Cytobacillus firmus]
MWRHCPGTTSIRRALQEGVLSFWKGLASLSSLGAATRQACDLQGAGAGARQLTNFKIYHFYLFRKPQHLYHPFLRAEVLLNNNYFFDYNR